MTFIQSACAPPALTDGASCPSSGFLTKAVCLELLCTESTLVSAVICMVVLQGVWRSLAMPAAQGQLDNQLGYCPSHPRPWKPQQRVPIFAFPFAKGNPGSQWFSWFYQSFCILWCLLRTAENLTNCPAQTDTCVRSHRLHVVSEMSYRITGEIQKLWLRPRITTWDFLQ